MDLPEGFVLDSQQNSQTPDLPEGFVLDTPKQPSFKDEALITALTGANATRQALTGGLYDEIQGAGSGITSALQGNGYSTGYNKEMADQQAITKALQEAAPKRTMAANLTSGVLTPFKGMGYVGNIAEASGIGALEGATRAEPGKRLEGALEGGGTAAGITAVLPGVFKIGESLYDVAGRPLGKATGGLLEKLRGTNSQDSSIGNGAGGGGTVPGNSETTTFSPSEQQRADLGQKYGVRLSAGDITQNPLQQSAEDAMFMGRNGEAGRTAANEFQAGKQQEFANAVENARQQLAPGQELPIERGAGSGTAVQAVIDKARAERSPIDQAYKTAEEMVGEVPGHGLLDFSKGLTKTMVEDEGINSKLTPKAVGILQSLSQKANSVIKRSPPQENPYPYGDSTGFESLTTAFSPNPQIALKELDSWRAGLNAAMRTERQGTPDARALTLIKNKFDDYLSNEFNQGLASGNPNVLEAFQKARALRAEWGAKYQARNPTEFAKSFLEDVIHNDRFSREPYTGEQLTNMIFGASKLGFGPRATAIVDEIGNTIGKESPAFLQLKVEAADRLLKPIRDINLSTINLKSDPAIQTYKTALKNFATENPNLRKTLFSEDEWKTLREIGDLGTLAFQKVRSKTNPSGSGYTLIDWLDSAINKIPLPKQLGFVKDVAQIGVGSIKNKAATDAFKKATNPETQRAYIIAQKQKEDFLKNRLMGKDSGVLMDTLAARFGIGAGNSVVQKKREY